MVVVVDLTGRLGTWLPADAVEALRRELDSQCEVLTASSAAELTVAMGEAEVYFGVGITTPLFLAAPRLRWIHLATASVASALFEELVRSDVPLTNAAGVTAVPIAEHVVGGILYFLRSLDVALARQRQAAWDEASFTEGARAAREVAGCRVLVIGTGHIGSAVAERLAAFGARCVGVRRRLHLGVPKGFQRVVGAGDLDGELPRADVVVVAAPRTSETTALLDESRLALLPRHAVVVNVARGGVVDEAALGRRLRAGALRGAVLDVFSAEPLPPESPLWPLSSALVTPHVAAASPHVAARQLGLFTDNLRRYLGGEPLQNVVDKAAGY
jgi:phosphoglycerate dehydrogenase-like enzyme